MLFNNRGVKSVFHDVYLDINSVIFIPLDTLYSWVPVSRGSTTFLGDSLATCWYENWRTNLNGKFSVNYLILVTSPLSKEFSKLNFQPVSKNLLVEMIVSMISQIPYDTLIGTHVIYGEHIWKTWRCGMPLGQKDKH